MRIASDRVAKDGGYIHPYGGKKPTYIPPARPAPKVNLDFEKLHCCMMRADWTSLGNKLGVSDESLSALDVRYHAKESAWAIPMRDGENKIIGIHLRSDDGSKRAVTGSRNGLFLPQGIEPQKVAFVCEGASNTAALLTMGYFAIGRPSCNTGGEMLKVALKRLGVARIVVVADNDSMKVAPDGRKFWPGQDGGKKLKKELGLMSVIFTPMSPLKDVRQMLNKFGVETARKMIDSSVAGKVWTKV